MKQLIGAVVGCLGFVLLVSTGCGGSSFEGGGGGDTASGGKASAGAGGSATSGGAASGGIATGGSSLGGLPSGGSALAGSPGGGAPGGGMPSGGMAGDTSGCNTDSDCIDCAYPTAPQKEADCYCAGCAATPMSKSTCAANQADFSKVCANVVRPCPAIACILPPTPACKSHQCVAK